METRYLTVHSLPGVAGLGGATEIQLLPRDTAGPRAFITLNRDTYYEHFRRLKAYGALAAGSIVGPGVTPPAPQGSPRDRFEEVLRRTVVQEAPQDGALLVIEVVGSVDQPELEHLLDVGEFGIKLRLFDTSPMESIAATALRDAFSGLALALPESATDFIRRVGQIAYAIEPDTGRLLYSSDVTVSAGITIQVHLNATAVANAAATASAFRNAGDLANITRLLWLSASSSDNSLLSFLAAWTGLELFTQDVFRRVYEPRLYGLFGAAAPTSLETFLSRTRGVMNERYNIRDKFVAVASALGGAEAEADIAAFRDLKARRDNLAHTMREDPDSLPAEATRVLLRKYLRLHLNP